FFRDVDVRVELINEIVGRRFANLGVLKELGARVRPVIWVEQLAVGPHREDRKDRQHRRAPHQHLHQDSPATRDRRSLSWPGPGGGRATPHSIPWGARRGYVVLLHSSPSRVS